MASTLSSSSSSSSSSFSFSSIFTSFSLPKTPKYHHVIKAQRLRDEGNSANIVDANLSILSKRIEMMRSKERLNDCYRLGNNYGWNYKSGYDDGHKRRLLLAESIEVAASVGTTLGFVFLTGSIFIFLFSLLLHIPVK